MANQGCQSHTSELSGPALPGFQFHVVGTIAPNVVPGRAIFTMVEIPQGALILEEAPFVYLGENDFDIPLSKRSHALWQMLSAWLPSFGHGTHYDKFKANALRCGRLRTPNSVLEVNASGLFVLASWLNSSCAPNVHAHWNATTRSMEFRAVRKIWAEEELCICYDVNALLFGKQDRQRILHDGYGFVCLCQVCSLPDTFPSDLRRDGQRRIVETGVGTVVNPNAIDKIQDAIDKTRAAVRELRRDGVHHFGDTLHYDLYKVLGRAGDRTNAMLCLLAARNLACTMVGRDDPRVTQLTAALPHSMREDYNSDSWLLQ